MRYSQHITAYVVIQPRTVVLSLVTVKLGVSFPLNFAMWQRNVTNSVGAFHMTSRINIWNILFDCKVKSSTNSLLDQWHRANIDGKAL